MSSLGEGEGKGQLNYFEGNTLFSEEDFRCDYARCWNGNGIKQVTIMLDIVLFEKQRVADLLSFYSRR